MFIGTEQNMRTFREPEFDLNDKVVLITGGTGSFGQAFTRTVLQRFRPRKLIVFSRDEVKQFEMAQLYSPDERGCMRYFIGDVRDRNRLDMALRDVDIVVHAAALKQVPTAEYNPFECINTNVMGAENVLQSAIHNGVRQVIALSTDKAASPINLYGASKLASDKIFIAANNLSGVGGTKFSVVRYGNVIGSRGSVALVFAKLIREGAESLPITDPRMTRFWITLQQGVDFVLSCFELMEGGEIFVPKIPSMKVTDFVRVIAPDTPHRTIGIRPGEKLHEVMITEDDARMTVELDDRYVMLPAFAFWGRDTHKLNGAPPVREGFSYASNTNAEWLQDHSLREMLVETDLMPDQTRRGQAPAKVSADGRSP